MKGPRPKLATRILQRVRDLDPRRRKQVDVSSRKEPFIDPPSFKIPHPHAVHIATSDNPPPGYILTVSSPGQGLRPILLPQDISSTAKHDPCGVIICNCTNPLEPDKEPPSTHAKLIHWTELELNKIPKLRSYEHFVASPVIFLDPSPGLEPAAFLIQLPPDIAARRSLQGANAEELTATLDNKTRTWDDNWSDVDYISNQIYLELLNLPESIYETPTAPPLSPPPQRTRLKLPGKSSVESPWKKKK
jgi:hypothetical protein